MTVYFKHHYCAAALIWHLNTGLLHEEIKSVQEKLFVDLKLFHTYNAVKARLTYSLPDV